MSHQDPGRLRDGGGRAVKDAAAPPVLDRPWHRPGRFRYAISRVAGALRPPVTVYEPPAGAVRVEGDVPVITRDGTILRINVYRPPGDGPVPVLMSAHPYGKDKVSTIKGRRSHVSFQFRLMRQTGPIRLSTLTSWEAPDPAWWVGQGYAVINADLRGAGTSGGTGSLLSEQEAEDVYDLIGWAGAQEWSTGAVGLLGVSYLAMSQYRPAGLKPASLKAICPWEGLTDIYRDLMRPGGIREDGFARIWAMVTARSARLRDNLAKEQKTRPLRDQWWESRVPDLASIDVPMLVCASFSDNNLHSRGSFRAFEHTASTDRFVYTHRSGKWEVFYSAEARHAQLAFFDKFLRGTAVPPPPRVRLEVREDRDTVTAVREESDWPLAKTQWRQLFLGAEGRLAEPAPDAAGSISFSSTRRAAAFTYTTPVDLELTGPMALSLWVQVHDAKDVTLFAGVEKWRGGRYVPFEGSYGFGRDRITTGWQRAALRELDEQQSAPGRPVHTFRNEQLLQPGEIVPVQIALGPSATLFRAGESLRLVVSGRWLWPRNPLTGQFPAHYRHGRPTRVTLHWGPDRPAYLLVPEIPDR